MLLRDFFQGLNKVIYKSGSPEYIKLSAGLLAAYSGSGKSAEIPYLDTVGRGLKISCLQQLQDDTIEPLLPGKKPDRFVWIMLEQGGSGWIVASHSYYLYSFCANLAENSTERDITEFEDGKYIIPSFSWHRTAYDYFLTQEGRVCRGFSRESYVREMAANGFTHLEVNGLAYPMGLETGPKGETYPMFYTYCPALDQFVYSKLNKGLYPYYYLEANLNFLRENARQALKYGLIPGLLCFEPRSVPEKFFTKYPMLRGARVDHPFRSFQPRYNMTITHPKVREHYAEMVRKLMKEVPELGFLNIWTNDSGAGFEHTKSLYVGRNGGAYLIREWKDDGEIARLAGENALRFLRTLRDAAQEANPGFRVITRMESFYGEHDVIMNGLAGRIDIETSSLVQRGWQMPYHHPKYNDQNDINAGSVYQQDFKNEELLHIRQLESKDSHTSIYFAYGPQTMFAPLLGIPYPRLTYQRLSQLNRSGIKKLSHMGGSVPPELAPYNINHQLIKAYQFNPELDIDDFLYSYAVRTASKKHAEKLLSAWDLAEKAILAFPVVSSLYSTIGFAWYRLWTRPLVPDIEAIPQEDRDYYENFMCTTPHNPNNIDFSRDVLFSLISPEKAVVLVRRIDENVWDPLDEAIGNLGESTEGVLHDQRIRLTALRCWIMTQRNIASWVELVYGYLNGTDDESKARSRSGLKLTIEKEIYNTRLLISLFSSGVEFMALTDSAESPLVYGSNIYRLLEKRIMLMERHITDEPYIDMDYIERKAGEPIF